MRFAAKSSVVKYGRERKYFDTVEQALAEYEKTALLSPRDTFSRFGSTSAISHGQQPAT